jgi:hypothetical protein
MFSRTNRLQEQIMAFVSKQRILKIEVAGVGGFDFLIGVCL